MAQRKPPTGNRAQHAVIVSMGPGDEGQSRPSFDDGERAAGGKNWQVVAAFTHVDLAAQSLRELALTDQQLTDIGLAVVARLQALNQTRLKPARKPRR